jgi:hypothetical protein
MTAHADKRIAFTVGALSFGILVMELAVSRLSVFYLDYGSSFLAIPLTLFGLAIGSLHVHLGKYTLDRFKLFRHIIYLLCASAISLAVVFFLFSSFYPIERNLTRGGSFLSGLWRTLIFSGAFIPTFYVSGKILTVIFTKYKRQIGQLYGIDLLAAGAACLVTPFFLHFLDLPYLIFLYLAVLAVNAAILLDGRRTKLLTLCSLLLACGTVTVGLGVLEEEYDFSKVARVPKDGTVSEIAHRWNEYSRVSLLRVEPHNRAWKAYRIIHDNGESNVWVSPFRDGAVASRNRRNLTYLPFLIGSDATDVLVMFAGCGAQMLDFYHFTKGAAHIDGVEINPLVKEFALHPELESYRLKEFYALPNVELHIKEGRRFLAGTNKHYDVIYAASDSATSQYKSGHSRKYLDTAEAVTRYVEMLRDGGIIVFKSKPAWPKIALLREALAKQGLTDFPNSIIVLSDEKHHDDAVMHHTIVKKDGFSPDQVKRITEHYPQKRIMYAPGARNIKAFEHFIVDGDSSLVPAGYKIDATDDAPYIHLVDFENYSVSPSEKVLRSWTRQRSWTRISTMLMISALATMIIAGLYCFTRRSMPGVAVFGYLLISGIAYMVCEVVFIGKLELFLDNPLYSMALLISVFLGTNGLGSIAVKRVSRVISMRVYPIVVAGVVLVSLVFAALANQYLLASHFVLKIVLAIVFIAPVGFCLGVFYPYAVLWLDRSGHARAIPVTYGISTLSSVMGATYAMTLIINIGYSAVLVQAALAYAALGLFLLVVLRPKVTA